MRLSNRRMRPDDLSELLCPPLPCRAIKNVFHHRSAALALLLAMGWVPLANASLPESDLAAPGSPLYELAVKESIRTLSQQEQSGQADDIPPSPGPDYYWCKNCKAYHKRKPPASPAQPDVQRTAPAQDRAGEAVRPPSPGPEYYWCENCNAYHRPQAQQAHSHPVLPAHPAAGSGEAAAPGNYYYCENCKAFHLRQPILQQPMRTNTTPSTATNAP